MLEVRCGTAGGVQCAVAEATMVMRARARGYGAARPWREVTTFCVTACLAACASSLEADGDPEFEGPAPYAPGGSNTNVTPGATTPNGSSTTPSTNNGVPSNNTGTQTGDMGQPGPLNGSGGAGGSSSGGVNTGSGGS